MDLLRSTYPDDPELTAALDLLGAAWRQQRPAWLALEFAAIGAEVGRAGELAGNGDMLGCLRLLEALRSKLLRGEAVSAP